MITASFFVINLFLLLRYKLYKFRQYLFVLTIIVSFLFFSISDPLLGMPIYVYFCIFSILISIPKIIGEPIRPRLLSIIFLINIVMIVQIINLEIGIFNPKSLLINQSNTDLLDLSGEFFVPKFDFNVLKHFVFFDIFLFFIYCNNDFIANNNLIKKSLRILNILIFILFVLIYTEFAIANLINVNYLIKIYNILGLSTYNVWQGFLDYYVVSGWLPEPSSIIISFPFFLACAEKSYKKPFKYFLLFLFGAFAVFLTNSSTGIIMVAFAWIYFLLNLLKKRKNKFFLIYFIFTILGLYLIIRLGLFSSQIEKILQFAGISQQEWGSSSFRINSIKYALYSFCQAPLFGVGIGTVYCHGMFFQVIANIGVLGLLLMIILINVVFKGKHFSVFKVSALFILYCASGLVEEFTSPYLLVLLYTSLSNVYTKKTKKYSKKYSNKQVDSMMKVSL